jgi:predicted dehydrogenase
MKRWRVAVLGLGHWYSAYGLARALPGYPHAELVAAAWHDRDQLDAFTSAFGVKGYADARDLLAREEVDIVQIAAPVAAIPDLAIAAAQAGTHIVLGKPMAMTVAQADRMIEAVDRAGVSCLPFQCIMRLRMGDVKRRIDAGTIGDVLVMHQTSRWSIAEDSYRSGTPGWFVDPAQVPGGAFIDEGIYWIDFFQWMAGSDVIQVDAKMANLVHTDIAVEDWGMATFTFANGTIATLEAAWTINAPQKSGPSPKQNAVVRLEIVGRQGELAEQWFRAPGRAVLAAGAEDWVHERQSEEPFAAAPPMPLDHVIQSLEHGTPTVATIHDARASFATALAAYQSAREGRRIRLT